MYIQMISYGFHSAVYVSTLSAFPEVLYMIDYKAISLTLITYRFLVVSELFCLTSEATVILKCQK